MPLSCDCYGGCWGTHSADWPSIPDPDGKYRAWAVQNLPYGTYVTMNNTLRLEQDEYINQVLRGANNVQS